MAEQRLFLTHTRCKYMPEFCEQTDGNAELCRRDVFILLLGTRTSQKLGHLLHPRRSKKDRKAEKTANDKKKEHKQKKKDKKDRLFPSKSP